MKKNHPFVFLPTDKQSRLIFLEHINEYLVLDNDDKKDIFDESESYAYAYILSDEIAKSKEWYYLKGSPVEILQQPTTPLSDEVWKLSGAKKIIATNNPELHFRDVRMGMLKGRRNNVPSISDSDLECLVELHKKGIKEVDIEYDEIWGKPYMAKGRGIEISPSEYKPKLKDGNIVIVKDKFDVPDRTDKELIGMIKQKGVDVEKLATELEEFMFGKGNRYGKYRQHLIDIINPHLKSNGGFSLEDMEGFSEYVSEIGFKKYAEGWCQAGGSNGWHCTTEELFIKYKESKQPKK